MRGKELRQVRLIECLIQHKSLTLRPGKEEMPSFYSCFHIFYDGKTYVSEDAAFSYKTLDRNVSDLVEMGIFCKMDNVYTINYNKFFVEEEHTSKEQEKILEALLESGEFDTYYEIKKQIFIYDENRLFDQDCVKRYQKSVKLQLKKMDGKKTVIRCVNRAIKESAYLKIAYSEKEKNKTYLIFPISYIMNRDGKKCYLYGTWKNKMKLFLLKKIVDAKLDKVEKKNITDYQSELEKLWNVELSKPVKVKILIRKNTSSTEKVLAELRNYLVESDESSEEYYIFTGEIYGISDFKSWIRKHIDTCVLLEPKICHDEILKSLKSRKERYGEL